METRRHEDHEAVAPETERVARTLVNSAFQVHATLGPGLLESLYEHCLAFELDQRRIAFLRQVALPITYGSVKLDAGYRIDLLVAEQIVVEIKAVDALAPVHQAQLLTYLKLSGRRLGFLLNFNVPLFKQGIKRMVL